MSRPRKKTVDYFPHRCHHGKTLFIVQQRYGNDGYSCWFHLLEELGKADGHFLDVRDPADWEYLTAITCIEPGLLRDILSLFVRLGAIDRELWENGVVYSQNFVDGVADVYRGRLVDVPTKEGVLEFITQETGFLTTETPDGEVSGAGNPQSKVKESKVNKRREEKSQNAGEPASDETEKQVIEIPLKSGEFYVTAGMVDRWRDVYPAIKVVQVLKMIREWNLSHPGKRKTEKGIMRHITGWLTREQGKAEKSRPINIRKMVGSQKPVNLKKAEKVWVETVRRIATDPGSLAAAMEAGDVTENDLKLAGVK